MTKFVLLWLFLSQKSFMWADGVKLLYYLRSSHFFLIQDDGVRKEGSRVSEVTVSLPPTPEQAACLYYHVTEQQAKSNTSNP